MSHPSPLSVSAPTSSFLLEGRIQLVTMIMPPSVGPPKLASYLLQTSLQVPELTCTLLPVREYNKDCISEGSMLRALLFHLV